MNMNLPSTLLSTSRPVENRTNTARLIDAHNYIQKSRIDFEPIPDEAMDHLTEALEVLKKAICAEPVTSSADIAAKLRFAASLVEDDEGGVLYAEATVLHAALNDLGTYRIKEATKDGRMWIDQFYLDIRTTNIEDSVAVEPDQVAA